MRFNPGIMSCEELEAYKHDLLKKYQKQFSLTTFVETGTHRGDAVGFAQSIFKEMYSFELDPFFYSLCETRFKNVSNVHVTFGDSEIELEKTMDRIPSLDILFWLDAHAPEGDLPSLHAFSGFAELENLLKRPLKNCVILVDDIYCDDFYNQLIAIAPDAEVEMGIARIVLT